MLIVILTNFLRSILANELIKGNGGNFKFMVGSHIIPSLLVMTSFILYSKCLYSDISPQTND